MREAQTRGGKPSFARAASGQTVAAWRAHWAALRSLAVAESGTNPVPGDAAVSIETYLRGRGQVGLAERWREAVQKADGAMQSLASADTARVESASADLKVLTALMQNEVGAALEVGIGDGD